MGFEKNFVRVFYHRSAGSSSKLHHRRSAVKRNGTPEVPLDTKGALLYGYSPYVRSARPNSPDTGISGLSTKRRANGVFR